MLLTPYIVHVCKMLKSYEELCKSVFLSRNELNAYILAASSFKKLAVIRIGRLPLNNMGHPVAFKRMFMLVSSTVDVPLMNPPCRYQADLTLTCHQRTSQVCCWFNLPYISIPPEPDQVFHPKKVTSNQQRLLTFIGYFDGWWFQIFLIFPPTWGTKPI